MAPKKKKTPNFLDDLNEGGLHRALGVKESKNVPKTAINTLANAKIGSTVTANGKKKKVTTKLKKKAQFAKNASTWNHKGKK